MELTTPGRPAQSDASRWPNMFIFPKELRDAIPEYGGRALVFDAVSGAPSRSPAWFLRPEAAGADPRAHVRFLVHETGGFDVEFQLVMDVDSETLRALGKFFVDLADQADDASR